MSQFWLAKIVNIQAHLSKGNQYLNQPFENFCKKLFWNADQH